MASTFVNEAGEQFIRGHLQQIPRPDRYACGAIRKWVQRQGHDLDPDQTDVVTLHYRGNEAVIVQRLPLSQAVLSNWQGETNKNLIGQLLPGHWAGTLPNGPLTIVEHLPEPGVFDNSARFSVFNGLFRRSTPARYDSTTHLPIDVEAMQRFIWGLDFHTRFTAMLDDYWSKAQDIHCQSQQISYIAACNKQVQEGSLSDTGRQLAWQAAGLMQRASGLEIRPLNVYGYAATDIIQVTDPAHQQVLLYLPGNSSPFHEFDGMEAMKDWFGEQCSDSEKRQRLRQYFKLADTPDGLDFSGLDTALDGLGTYPRFHTRSPNRPGFTVDGPWPPRDYVNYKAHKYSPLIEGDLFEALTLRQRKRSYADADFLITSKTQVTKARWRDYLVTSINLLAPLALVVPELIPLLAVGGIAQFGLGIDQAINGKTLEDKANGVGNIEFGLLNAAPLLLRAAIRMKVLFPGKDPRFIMPTRVNDQLGYPLSPMDPPKLPEEGVAQFFAPPPEPIALAQDSHLVNWIARFIDSNGVKHMEATLEDARFEVRYDSEHDAFVRPNSKDASPTYYQVSDQSNGLEIIDISNRTVTDGMRMRTLRGLGVDLQLPIEIPTPTSEMLELPKQILNIWVGDKVIPDNLLKTVEANARGLLRSRIPYRLYLSNADSDVYRTNHAALLKHAENLQILPLEDQAFYDDFQGSPYFEQYEKAIKGGNYASACDVLRYQLLNSEGGVYIDIDDTLRTLGNHPDADAMIASTPLKATQNGLVLGAPMDNSRLGMHCAYSNSLIGSHAGNDTLDAISDEILKRFEDNPNFYDSRPLYGAPDHEIYAKKLNEMTGPGVLNDVIDDEDYEDLSRLRILRQITKLESVPQKDFTFLTSPARAAISEALRSDQTLRDLVTVGNNNSWAKP